MFLARCWRASVVSRLLERQGIQLVTLGTVCRSHSYAAWKCRVNLACRRSQHVANPRRTYHVGLALYLPRSYNQLLSDEDSKEISFQKENIWTIPNLLSLLRLASSPVLGYLVLTEKYLWALGLFTFAGFTDLIDGVIARRFPSQSSMLGSVLDPLADKSLMAVLCVSLTIANLLPFPLALLILGRDLLLVLASFYMRYATLPPPRTWSRYWDIQRSAVQITPTFIGKVNTLLQLVLVGLSVGAPVLGYVDHLLLQVLWYVVGFTTVVSSLSYSTQLRGFRLNLKKTNHAS